MTVPPLVTVLPDACGTHTLQLYAGLTDLAHAGRIRLAYKRRPDPDDRVLQTSSLWLTLAREGQRLVRVCVDLFDGPDIASPDGLAKCDVYFKRSYAPDHVAALPAEARAKIRPMGLNFGPIGDHDRDVWVRWRIETSLRERAGRPVSDGERSFRRMAVISSWERPWWPDAARRWLIPRARHFEHPPDAMTERIVFQSRVWPPEETPREPRVAALNEERAALVRALRRHFGARFIGGLIPTPYARQHFPDCVSVLPGDQWSYLALIRSAQIGILTDGVHRSIPFKCAEYLAASRCIVGRQPAFELPVPLVPETHWLPFAAVEECVAACDRLLSNHELAREMQRANQRYYQAYVRPASLVAATLDAAATACS